MWDLLLPRSFARSSFLECAGSAMSVCVLLARGGPTYSSIKRAEGCLAIVELAAPTRGFGGMWTYLIALPPVFLLFRLECAPSPLASRARVHVLAWGLAHRAKHYVARHYSRGIGVRSPIQFDARGKASGGHRLRFSPLHPLGQSSALLPFAPHQRECSTLP